MSKKVHTLENSYANHMSQMLQYLEGFLSQRFQEDQ